jgi:hypothetical protein
LGATAGAAAAIIGGGGGGVSATTGGGGASPTGRTQPGRLWAALVAAPATAAAPTLHSAARDWAEPKTLSATRGLSAELATGAAGAALATALVARLNAAMTADSDRTEV